MDFFANTHAQNIVHVSYLSRLKTEYAARRKKIGLFSIKSVDVCALHLSCSIRCFFETNFFFTFSCVCVCHQSKQTETIFVSRRKEKTLYFLFVGWFSHSKYQLMRIIIVNILKNSLSVLKFFYFLFFFFCFLPFATVESHQQKQVVVRIYKRKK